MIGNGKLWAGVLAVVLFGGAWLYLGQIRAERDQAVSQAQALARENAGLKAEVLANARALEARENKRAALAAEKEALRGQLGEIYENDPDALAWRDSPCPDGVTECLRR
jgi:hypothetical protein